MSLKFLIILIILFAHALGLSAETESWIKNTINLTINTDFDSALVVIEKELEQNPEDYRAWFYLAATYNSKMTHFENENGFDQFDQATDKTINLVNNQFDGNAQLADSTRAQLLFYLGSAYGYRAYLQGRQGQYFAAISNGLKSVGYLNESLEYDSTLYGAYLGIGVYKYWRYSRLNFISWLPFVPDDREEGIAMINIAIANDSLSKYMAMHQLIYILLDYSRYDEALVLAEIVIDKYPKSQFMWWANAHAYFKKGNFQQAEASYGILYQLIQQDHNRNMTHLIKCQYKMALTAHYMRNDQLCRQYCEALQEYSQRDDLDDAALDILSDAEDLWEDCRQPAEE